MNKTRVDDMLIEMISPKIKEIEEKFSRGEGLSQDDKLNETVASVKALEGRFEALEGKFDLLKSDIEITIQKALNKNMMLLISVMGLFIILSKIVDKF